MPFETFEEQKHDFLEQCFDTTYESIMEWIAANLPPQELYGREQLEEWARVNGWTPPQE